MRLSYREYNIPHAAVDAVWDIAVTGQTKEAMPYPVAADGCLDILVQFRQGNRRLERVETLVVGPQSRAAHHAFTWQGGFIGIRFAPGWGGQVLGLEASEFRDCQFTAGDWPKELNPLATALETAPNEQILRCRLDQGLARLLADTAEPHAVARMAIQSLRASRGVASLDEMAAEIGVSRRTLHRQVMQASGLAPKQLARIFRAQHGVRLARSRDTDLATLAAELGFADQAHMTREFRALTGVTPGKPSALAHS